MLDSNYYKVGGSLEYQHPTYVVRNADAQLYQGLINGEFCYVLNSRQMGKSSLRVQMTKKLKAQGIKCVSIDMTRIGSHVTPEEWYGGLMSELLRGFRLSRKINFSNWWRDRSILSPVQRLSEFIDDVLLIELSDKIVIFIDEIDSILKIKFKDDFFAFIRACYNQRVDNPDYQRLTFCLLGVATPSDLIADKQRTPFNIGQAIELTGFTFAEAKSALIKGLQNHVENAEAVLTEVLDWTGGQPFLTQKLCYFIVQEWDTMGQEFHPDNPSATKEIESLVQQCIIENWEVWDEPEHLRTIRDRILANEQRAGRLLGLYQHILQQGQIPTDESPEQVELRLTGLVVRQQGNLKVYNPIYAGIFNHRWVEQELANLRPYSQAIRAWEVSNRQDKSRLLRGEALQEALAWAANKSLGVVDYAFLTESQQQELEAERQAKQILASAKQKAEQLLAEAKEGSQIERAGVKALRQFESGFGEIEALLAAMESGEALRQLVQDGRPVQTYPATSPLLALQVILDNIREYNQFSFNQGKVRHVDVMFNPNGKYFATVTEYASPRLWNLSGKQLAKFKGHQGMVKRLTFSPNGQYLATASEDGTAKVWDLSGNLIADFIGHSNEVRSVCFSPDSQYLATASADSTARLWDLSGKKITEFIGHNEWVNSVDFSPNGQYLVTASGDSTANLWDLSGKQIAECNGHQGVVTCVSFSPQGDSFATASTDQTARLWDLSGKQIATFNRHQGGVTCVRFSPQGEFLATASADQTARLWDLSGKQIAAFNGHANWVKSISFSPQGNQLITASSDRTIKLWHLLPNPQPEFKGHTDWVEQVSFSPQGEYLATASADGTAKLWDLSGKLIAEFNGHESWVRTVCFSPRGEHLVTASEDGTARLWNLAGKLIVEFRGHQGIVTCASFSPDEKTIATTSDDRTLRLWDLSGNQLRVLKSHKSRVWHVCFSPDGERLATTSGNRKAQLWNVSGKLLAEFKGHRGRVGHISFSPNGQSIATASTDRTARLWNLSGTLLAKFKGHQGGVSSVSFSPDGQYLATGSGDGTARLWDLSGNPIAEYKGHQGRVSSVSFSPDGQYLATSSNDCTARLWRVEGLNQLLYRGCQWLKDYLASHPQARRRVGECRE
ncbi:WD40 domain-containing protein [Coleofasciculus sp. E2-BRE-01]|uniref:WD40 domain-containing protein n=1 Tax=Coleofasciculus sp. E2-BRE-01 TaxID=3069524 RepID=UPI0032F5B08A